MIEMLSRYGIREMVQSGVVAMSRGPFNDPDGRSAPSNAPPKPPPK